MIYVSTACLHRDRIGEVLEEYALAGIKNIELSGGTSYYPQMEQELCFYQKKYGLNYVCHAYFPPHEQDIVVNLASCNDRIYEDSIEHYKKCIDLLHRIDCKVLSIHAGFFIEIKSEEVGKELSDRCVYNKKAAMERFCKAYYKISELCKKHDIRLYLENNVLSAYNYEKFGKKNQLMLTDYDAFVELNHNIEFEFLLDLGHLYVTANTLGINYKEQCKKLQPFTRWLHISHNNGITDQHDPLREDSEIIKIYRNIFNDQLPVTLETNGSIEDILRSKKIVEEVWQ